MFVDGGAMETNKQTKYLRNIVIKYRKKNYTRFIISYKLHLLLGLLGDNKKVKKKRKRNTINWLD